MAEIPWVQYDPKSTRLIVMFEPGRSETGYRLLIDEETQPGRFVETPPFGMLYSHTPEPPYEWHWPGSWWPDSDKAEHHVAITYRIQAPALKASYVVPKPKSTLAGEKFTPEQLLPLAWDAGFQTERDLIRCCIIARGEGGWWTKARNWTPGYAVDGKWVGFRPADAVIGVEGPTTAWNRDRTQQAHSDRGLFQYSSYWFKHITDATCDDPALAVKALFDHTTRQGWGSWAFGGDIEEHYGRFIPEVQPAVTAFLASKQ